MTLFPKRQKLVQDPKFLKALNNFTHSAHGTNALGCVMEELRSTYPVHSGHPVAAFQEQYALRDRYLQGVADAIDLLVNFQTVNEPDQKPFSLLEEDEPNKDDVT